MNLRKVNEVGEYLCKSCDTYKSKDQFYKDNSRLCGIVPYCKVCANKRNTDWRLRTDYTNKSKERRKILGRKWQLKTKFGLTEQNFKEILESQGNKCGICDSSEPGGNGTWHVDHDHLTKKIRGILCGKCNHLLGFAKDSPKILRDAAIYLEPPTIRVM